MSPDRRRSRIVLAGALLAWAAVALPEQLTISTSYPAPVGVYNYIITTGADGLNTILARSGGRVGIGVPSPATKLEVAQHTAIKLGSAYLSSGGPYMHLAKDEWYDGTAGWQGTAPGSLIQMYGQEIYFYSHDGAGNHNYLGTVSSAGDICNASGKCLSQSGGMKGAFQLEYYCGSGGMFCVVGNPLTGGCSCPAGTSAYLIGVFYLNCFWQVQPDYLYGCF